MKYPEGLVETVSLPRAQKGDWGAPPKLGPGDKSPKLKNNLRPSWRRIKKQDGVDTRWRLIEKQDGVESKTRWRRSENKMLDRL